jgi:RimJ/RimL family protein N-acetyltransferase
MHQISLPLQPVSLEQSFGRTSGDFRGVSLVHAGAEHADQLHAVTPPETFQYFLSCPADATPAAFASWFDAHRTNPKNLVFVVLGVTAGAQHPVLGSTSYLDVDPANRALEVGCTWYVPNVRGTLVNPACKLALLRHAFETLDCVRVTLKCDERNMHSQRAIAGIGAVREGVLRNHRIRPLDGYVRNTVMYSVTRENWPRVRDGLTARIGLT